ncbi:phage virion morphogenesis protein [Acidovorax sp. BLS4]|uniref:phage virion morphogenesis protein n=1 Tax=Acidovorax sp. BLS4 TaxID=3273430 RepID=UPI00294287B7|nr:phage virion morphogenesis protein [Paracidovorax avenae]WOI46979.1 phage virion morphogenesis protein [Paracidovorax avenae]
MAGTQITMTVEDRLARAMLARQALPSTGPLAPRLGEYLQSSTQARFKTQTAPDGTPWAPLKPRYARRKKYHQDKVLTLRGYLRSGIHYQVVDDNTVAVGTNAKYGAIHQFGGEIDQPERAATVRYRSVAGKVLFAGKKHKTATERAVTIPAHKVKMPARPYLGISAADDAEIREIIREWVVERSLGRSV